MKLIFASDDGATFAVDVDPDLTFGDMQALLEAETRVPPSEQLISAGGRELAGTIAATLRDLGLQDNDVLLFRARSYSQGDDAGGDPIENARQQIFSNADLAANIRRQNPELVDAAFNDPARFRRMLPELGDDVKRQKERNTERLNRDPFDVEAQREIEEAIRQERVLENMQHAMEYTPESFGRVNMLYVEVEVNGQPVKAFVDSGAQGTIMNPRTAEKCGVMRLLDKRWAGMARGVGSAKILGRVHSAQIRVGKDLFLACTLDIMEGDVDLLFGLDMLQRHQACIDLEKNELRIQGRAVPFLAEHEIPKSMLWDPEEAANAGNPSAASAAANSVSSAKAASEKSAAGPSFPGHGNALGGPAPSTSGSRSHSEDKITSLTALGVDREGAVKLLDSTGGNVEMAASLLFSQFG